MDIKISNCNNIDTAKVSIVESQLNIKFAPNGTFVLDEPQFEEDETHVLVLHKPEYSVPKHSFSCLVPTHVKGLSEIKPERMPDIMETVFECLTSINDIHSGYYWNNHCDLCMNPITHDYYRDKDNNESGCSYEDKIYCHKCVRGTGDADAKKDNLDFDKMIHIEAEGQPNIGFGNLFNWLPILQDDEDNVIFVNAVEGPLFKKLAFCSCDNHGRRGIVASNITLDVNGECNKLWQELETKYTELDGSDLAGWNRYYNYPIKSYMDDQGWEVHFG